MILRPVKPVLKIRYFLWLGLAGLFAWELRTIPLRSIWLALQGLSLQAVTALILVNIGLYLLFSSRWWLILWAQGYRVPYLALVGYRLAGFSMSYFTPGPQFGGEPLQVHLTRKHHGVPGPAAVAAVTLDKLLELLVNFTFLVAGAAITIQTGLFGGLAIEKVLLFSVGLLALPVGYLLALWAGWRPLSRLGRHLPTRAGQRTAAAVEAGEGQAAVFCRRNPGTILAALTLSLVVWAGMILEYWLMLHFLGLPVSLAQAITALTAARLAFLAPAPGGLGALEASQVFAFQALGFSPVLAISATLLIRARDLTAGGLGLWWLGILTRGRAFTPVPVKIQD